MKYRVYEIRGGRAVRISRALPYDVAFERAEEFARARTAIEVRSEDGEVAVTFRLTAHEEKPCSP